MKNKGTITRARETVLAAGKSAAERTKVLAGEVANADQNDAMILLHDAKSMPDGIFGKDNPSGSGHRARSRRRVPCGSDRPCGGD
jgi:hypothetical protein